MPDSGMELARLVAASDQVAATSSRSTKRDVLAALLGAMVPAEIEVGVGFLVGEPRQGRVGVGWARDPDGGGFVMVGKTFKGLTDALLAWQTEALLAREIGRDDYTVHVRPELVVEVAIDGVQASTRYPGGVALRFARVKQYRPDKSAADADTIDTLRARLPG